MTKKGTELITSHSGDSHMDVPGGIWFSGMSVADACRMPRSVTLDDGQPAVLVDGRPFPVQEASAADEPNHRSASATDDDEPSRDTNDIDVRLKDLDVEGIDREIVFTSVAKWVHLIEDPVLLAAACSTLNDWLASLADSTHDRLVPAALLPMLEPSSAINEVRRIAANRLRLVQLPPLPPPGWAPWNHAQWDGAWDALEAAGIGVAFHAVSDRAEVTTVGRGATVANYFGTAHAGQRVAAELLSSGVLDQRPNLRVLIAEAGAGWVPHFADRLAEGMSTQGALVDFRTTRHVHEIVYDQIYTTVQNEPSAPAVCEAAGYSNAMFGRDYPHHEGTWGTTQQVLASLIDELDSTQRRRFLTDAFDELVGSH